MQALHILRPTAKPHHVPVHTDAKSPSNAAQKALSDRRYEVEAVWKLSMKDPMLGKTV